MESTAPKHRSIVVSLAMCLLGAGFILTGAGCPLFGPTDKCKDVVCPDGEICNPDTGECEPEAIECDPPCGEGEVCNPDTGECEPEAIECDPPCGEGEVCNPDTGECEPEAIECDPPCGEGEFCDLATGECVTNEQQYKNALDDFPHDLAAGGHFGQSCGECHHSEPNASGKGCLDCHDRDEALFSEEFDTVVPVLKDAMHNPDTGCRYCHDDETADGLWDCTKCHTALSD